MKTIPLSILPARILDKTAPSFRGIARRLERPGFQLELWQANLEIKPDVYIAKCIASTGFLLIFLLLFVSMPLLKGKFYPFAYIIVLIITIFVFFQQLNYPKIIAKRRIEQMETSLLPALRTMLVEVNSGVPLFQVLEYISRSDYGEISSEFKKAVKQIRSGKPQITVLEDLSTRNPSAHFRRALGQIINGLKTGTDIGIVLKEIINSVSREQMIQIESYGGKLKPLAMFYMLMVGIAPSLGITFLIAIMSFLSVTEAGAKVVFYVLLGVVMFFQIMFMGAIKSFRPSLLGE